MELKRTEIMKKLLENGNAFFSMLYEKADGSMRFATGRLHVSNPQHTLVPGTGKYLGESAEDAYKNHNNLKYFDCTVEGCPQMDQTPGKGNYRTAKIDRIKEITINKIHYIIID